MADGLVELDDDCPSSSSSSMSACSLGCITRPRERQRPVSRPTIMLYGIFAHSTQQLRATFESGLAHLHAGFVHHYCMCSPSLSGLPITSPSFSSPPPNSSPAFSTPVLQLLPLRLPLSFSTPTVSTPATVSVHFQSFSVQSCKISYCQKDTVP